MHITIEALEAYLAHRYKGWGNDQGMFMKLVEEIGEVAEVLNKKMGAKPMTRRISSSIWVWNWRT